MSRVIHSVGLFALAALVAAGCNGAKGSYQLTAPMQTIRVGGSFPLTVTAVDKKGATITDYHCSTKLTADDNSTLPTFAFTLPEQGVHTVAIQLNTAGTHTITAKQVDNSDFKGSLTINVQPGIKMVMTGIDSSTTTSSPATVHVALVDMSGAVATDYRGTVAFSSSDAVAYLPAQYTFTDTDAGEHDFVATLNTVGAQVLTATDVAESPLTASVNTDVAGPAYYFVPDAGGKIRLVPNAALSNPTLAALDLVAATDLTGYFVGFDVAVDAAKLAPAANLMTAGSALDPGTNPPAIAGAVPTTGPLANALVTGISQKASGNGAVTADATIPTGKVFYTVKLPLKPGSAAGTLMDGTVAKNKIRAGLRNRVGTEVVGAADVAIGKLIYTP
ncbi:MAG: Fibronectin type domain protein [Myxococcales bacterium]|nr:Fibronectin type domain protein [Myxococcales bacterium]